MTKTRKLTIRIPVDLYEYAKAKADDKGISLSQEVIDIIRTHKRVEKRVKDDLAAAIDLAHSRVEAMKPEPIPSLSERLHAGILNKLGFRR